VTHSDGCKCSVCRAKDSKSEAQYHIARPNQDHCSQCEYWDGNGGCSKVRGDISPRGWCNHFEKETD